MGSGRLLVDGLDVLVLGSPRAGLHGGDPRVVELVNLRDGKTLGLGHEEEGEDERGGDESGPDEADLGTEVGTSGLDDNRDDEGDDGVHSPVGGSRDRDTLGRQSSREGLSANDPYYGAPGHGESSDEDAREGDKDLAGNLLTRKGGSDGSDDDLTGEHHKGSPEEDVSSGELVDDIHSGEGHDQVNAGEDDLGNVRVVDTGGLEELDTVGEEEVDTGGLLSDLEHNTDHGSVEDSVVGAEAFPVGRFTHRVLSGLLELDDFESVLDFLVVLRNTTQTSDSTLALVVLALLGVEGRRLGRKSETDEEEKTPDELESNGDPPRSGSAVAVHAVVDAVGKEDTESDASLEGTGDNGSEVGRGCLSLVDRDQTGQSSNSVTGKNSATDELPVVVGRADLDCDTDDEQGEGDEVGSSEADFSSNETGTEGTNERSD